jgi:hypothetical protein
MPLDRDAIPLETAKTHRARLFAAFVYGEQDGRGAVNDNLRRLVGGLALAAAAIAGCVGFALVAGFIAEQGAR